MDQISAYSASTSQNLIHLGHICQPQSQMAESDTPGHAMWPSNQVLEQEHGRTPTPPTLPLLPFPAVTCKHRNILYVALQPTYVAPVLPTLPHAQVIAIVAQRYAKTTALISRIWVTPLSGSHVFFCLRPRCLAQQDEITSTLAGVCIVNLNIPIMLLCSLYFVVRLLFILIVHYRPLSQM